MINKESKMIEKSELEKKVVFHLNKVFAEEEAAEQSSSIDDLHTMKAAYHQSKANYYLNLIIIQNQEEILNYLKKE